VTVTAWRNCKLGDLLEIKHGYAFQGEYFANAGSHIVLTPGNFYDEGGFKNKGDKEKWYNGPIPSDYVLNEGDLIVAMTEQAEGLLGSSAIIPRSGIYLHNQRLGLVQVRDQSETDKGFLFYLFNSQTVRQQVRASASGVKIRHTAPSRIGEVKVRVPPLLIQRRIAGVLSGYDELIENNQRRIKILEEMARSLYREWFIHFRFPAHEKVKMVPSPLGPIPQGWEVKKLSDLISYNRSATKPGPHLVERRYVPIDCLPVKSLALLEAKPIEEAQSSLQLFETGDILFGAMRPYFHKVVIAPFAGVTRTTCFVFKSARPEFHAFATMTAFDESTVAYANAHSQGATIPYAVWEGSLAEMLIVIPSDALLRRFEKAVAPMLTWISQAFFILANLRSTRDLLLPRLLSGQINLS
jgi:type I restriction enzyme, S subunit